MPFCRYIWHTINGIEVGKKYSGMAKYLFFFHFLERLSHPKFIYGKASDQTASHCYSLYLFFYLRFHLWLADNPKYHPRALILT